MIKAMLGRKLKMSQIWDSHGRATPITRVMVEPNVIISFRDKEKDGYKAVQVGIEENKKANKPSKGHFSKAKLETSPRVIREVEFDGDLRPGSEIKLEEVFRKGGMVDIVGTSKGKGFAGVVKRHGFSGGPKTHGQSDRHRAPGSIGSGTTPGRVMKGMKMAGHMGSEQVTIIGLEIMDIEKDVNTLVIKGSVPGATGSLIVIKKSRKKKEAYHEPEIPAAPNLGNEEKQPETEDESSSEQATNTPEEKQTEEAN